MKRSKILLLVAVLLAGLVLYMAGPWKTEQQAVDFGNAGEIIKAVKDKAGQVKNYKYSTVIQAGSQIKISLTNKVDISQQKRQMVDFSWNIPKMSGMASLYTEGDKIFLYHPLKNKWLLPSEEPTASPFIDYFWKQLVLVDPVENILKVEPGENVSVTPGGDQAASDQVTLQVIPRGAALTEITKALPPQFAGAELTDVKQYFRISKQDLQVSNYEITANVSFFGLKTMDFNAVSKAGNFDQTEIKMPKALVEKMQQSK